MVAKLSDVFYLWTGFLFRRIQHLEEQNVNVLTIKGEEE